MKPHKCFGRMYANWDVMPAIPPLPLPRAASHRFPPTQAVVPHVPAVAGGSKEVEMSKSIDELMTPRSIAGRTDFPDDNMPDAMIESVVKKLLDRHVHFRRRESAKEQRAQKHDRFLRVRQIAFSIYKRSRATGAYEAVQGLSDLFNLRQHNDSVQDFDVRWDQALISASETLTDGNGCGSIVQVKILFSFRLNWRCRPRGYLEPWTTKLSKVESIRQTTH